MLPYIPEDCHVNDGELPRHLTEERDSVSSKERHEEMDDYGWSGPGSSQNSRKYQRFNERLKYKAVGKEVDAWFDATLVPNATLGPCVPYEECLARMEPYGDAFTMRAESILELVIEMEEFKSCDTGLAITLAEKASHLADELIADMKQKLVKLDIHNVGFVPANMVELYDHRCTALHTQIFFCEHEKRSIKEALMKEAIESASEGIRLCAFKKDRNAVATTNHLLHYRGCILHEMKRLEEAVVDFRGLCANLRASGVVRDDDASSGPTLAEATHDAIYTMALIKFRDSVPRPHYTDRERRRIQREFGIGLYEKSLYQCRGCGCRGGTFVRLSLCKSCKNVWSCSRECHARSRRREDGSGHHRAECEYLRLHGTGPSIHPNDIPGVINSIAANGVASVGGRAIMIDEDARELFDSITDEVLRILPLG